MNRWLRIVGAMMALGIFIVGIGCGLLIDRTVLLRFGPPPFHHGPRPPAENMRLRVVRQFERDLDLSPTQCDKVNAIMASNERERDLLFREMHPRMEVLMRRSNAEIGRILDEEQRKKFEKIVRIQEQRMKEFPGMSPCPPDRRPPGREPPPQP